MPSTDLFLAHRLDYIQRIGFVPVPIQLTPHTLVTAPAPSGISLKRITGIGCEQKNTKAAPALVGDREQAQIKHLFNADMFIGLHGHLLPLVFYICGSANHVAIYIGTWVSRRRMHSADQSIQPAQQETVNENQEMLEAMLYNHYPVIYLGKPEHPYQVTHPLWQTEGTVHAGFALGIPTIKPIQPIDGVLPIDRLIRSMAGSQWAVMVMAEPVREDVISRLRNHVINETQEIKAAMPSLNTPDPLQQAYTKILEAMLTSFTSGQNTGMWRTTAYLLGDRIGYHRLASLWRSMFSGEHSLPDPIRVWEQPSIAKLSERWEMLDELAVRKEMGPVQHLFHYQSLLTSAQLAAYVHLPQQEINGFQVTITPTFDVIPPAIKQGELTIAIGEITHHNRPTSMKYQVGRETLTRHTFISGATGAGKTNTIFFMLKQALAQHIPFLIIEPAKTEYRALLRDPEVAKQLRIFTAGNETISPLRLNPLEALPGTPISVHIDLLRSVFNASFGLWSPLPQILEESLHLVYQDKGWDITRNSNFRNASSKYLRESFPTLTDLVAKTNEIIQQKGWAHEVTSNMQAALSIRLNSLRSGGKGAMLDTQYSLPMEDLLNEPTIIELENMGDDDDKAFLMGIIFIRLIEYRRAQGEQKKLRHLLVIEEAHRLLSNVSQERRQEESNPRGKAVESFANILTEIRAYGQGIIIADQVPVKLAPDVIKNTNLKIVHRIVAKDDREALASTMAMNKQQTEILATLETGWGAVFSEGDDAPILVKVTDLKSQRNWPTHAEVKTHMSAIENHHKDLFYSSNSTFNMLVPAVYQADKVAKTLPDDPIFRREFVRLVISITENDAALDRLWDLMLMRIRTVLERGIEEKILQQCAIRYASTWFSQRRGSQNKWSYADTAELETKLQQVFLIKLARQDTGAALTALRACMSKLHTRSFDPFPGCSAICKQTLCLYRTAINDVIIPDNKKCQDNWLNAVIDGPKAMWNCCTSISANLIENHPTHEAANKRIAMCYAQQMLGSCFPEESQVMLQMLFVETQEQEER